MSKEEGSRWLAALIIGDVYGGNGADAIKQSKVVFSSATGMQTVERLIGAYTGLGEIDWRVIDKLRTGPFSVEANSLLGALIDLIDDILALPEAQWESYIAELQRGDN